MIYKSLILGVLFGIGIFAIKGGIGLSYYMFQKNSVRNKVGMSLLYALTYLLLFTVSAVILEKIDLIRHFAAIQNFVQSGMLIHLIMAGMLIVWGVVLLKKNSVSNNSSKGWLLLALPCPVCATVIFFSLGFLITFFPEFPMRVVLLLYLAFIVINLISVLVMVYLKKRSDSQAESFLGGAMILIAAYFILSVTIMPQFADVDKIYRLAMYQSDSAVGQTGQIFLYLIFITVLFLGGFAATTVKTKRINGRIS
ncbi:MAG: DUF2162 domain-containing protein [Proteobacteria bacterium]|nr:DUF2162 domain-containing protein [Pseudomonadota bacterium]